MTDFRFLHGGMFCCLWLLLIPLVFYAHMFRRKRQALHRFARLSAGAEAHCNAIGTRQRLKALLVLAAGCCMVVALARPACNPKIEARAARGRNVAVLVDVSRSMLAGDLQPSRLERAKLACLDLLEQLDGDRVALVAFAGKPVVKCPLTSDYAFFKSVVAELSPTSAQPGGSMIGEALRCALNEVLSGSPGFASDVVLLTDGEDHGSNPLEAAKALGQKDIRLIAVGLGDDAKGALIPLIDQQGRQIYLSHEGQPVWSRQDSESLEKMAAATRAGRFINAGVGSFDLGTIYRSATAADEKRDIAGKTSTTYTELFPFFLALASLLLIVEMILSESRSARGDFTVGVTTRLFILAALFCGQSCSGELRSHQEVAEANRLFAEAQYAQALELYEDAAKKGADPAIIAFNQGTVYFVMEDLPKARQAFEQATILGGDAVIAARAHYNCGGILYQEAQQHLPSRPREALACYELSIRHYRQALKLDAKLTMAAENIEIVRQRMEQIGNGEEGRELARGESSEPASDRDKNGAEQHGVAQPKAEDLAHRESADPTTDGQPHHFDQAGKDELHRNADRQTADYRSLSAQPMQERRHQEQSDETAQAVLLEEERNLARRTKHLQIGSRSVARDW